MKGFITNKRIGDVILIVSFISIFAAFLSMACHCPPYNERQARATEARAKSALLAFSEESKAKSTLRAFGETELAYAYINKDYHFGSWENLVDTGYIAPGYTRGNIIENYSLWTTAFNPSFTYVPGMAADGGPGDNTFTAVAFPRITKPPGYLSTFAIREDEILRAYNPSLPGTNAWGEHGDFGTRTWEPIR